MAKSSEEQWKTVLQKLIPMHTANEVFACKGDQAQFAYYPRKQRIVYK